MKYGLAFILFIFLIGCGEQSSETSSPEKDKTPFHKVTYLDNYYTDFLKAFKIDSSYHDNIYSEKIKDAIISDHFSKSEYSNLVLGSFSYPIQDTSGLTKYISDLNASRNQIEAIISSSFALCNDHLKNDSVVFYIVPACSDLKEIINKMGGVTGQTAGSKQILLTIDFSVISWKEVLKYAVAHEFNHSYWTNINYAATYKWTLLRYLVLEGKADSFAHLLYPTVKAPWTSSLAAKEKLDLWNKIKPDLLNDNPTLLGEVMFGSDNYPGWGGYTLGFDILQTAFKNHPELNQTNWTNLDADKILEMSDYK